MTIVLSLASVVIPLSGCTSEGKSSARPTHSEPSAAAPADVQTVRVEGNDALHFNPQTVAVRPGRVRIIFTVKGGLPQTFTAPKLNTDSGNVKPGASATLDIVIPRSGRYAFYSSYHRRQGMTGTIVAKS